MGRAATHFRRSFRDMTGVRWEDRYKCHPDERVRGSHLSWYPMRRGTHVFIELNYRKPALGGPDPPKHRRADASVPVEVRGLMEDMLYGKRETDGDTGAPLIDIFTAPRNQLSSWAVFQAFRTLQRIWEYLGSGRPVQWKSILHVSSLYRSLVPHPSGDSGPPAISNHHAVFLELGVLHSIWPWHGISDLLTKVYLRDPIQVEASWSLAHPLYHAYSSLPHGFRRLDDTSTTEFRRLKAYLETSCQPAHGVSLELKEIYRVFVKSRAPNRYREWIESNRSASSTRCGEERLLLWHGTPLDSLLGILDLGLQIKRKGASLTGSMFGNGIYLTDVSSKSVAYCRHERWEGEAVLLLCEADVGAVRKESMHGLYDAHRTAALCGGRWRCVKGLGRTAPKKWVAVDWPLVGDPSGGTVMMVRRRGPLPGNVQRSSQLAQPDTSTSYSEMCHASSLAFNEYVVYNPSHVLVRYLFRVKVRTGNYR